MITEKNSEVISDNSNVIVISDSRINHRNGSEKYVIIGFPRRNSVYTLRHLKGSRRSKFRPVHLVLTWNKGTHKIIPICNIRTETAYVVEYTLVLRRAKVPGDAGVY
jgi:hypothetical protein